MRNTIKCKEKNSEEAQVAFKKVLVIFDELTRNKTAKLWKN